MNAPENQLTRTLTDKAERFAIQHGSDLTLDGVLARAGEIRRGRRMRATMVMAAVVLAVAVPVGVTVLGESDTAPKKPTPARPVDHSAITLTGLKDGSAPRTGYLTGDRFVSEGGGNKAFDDAPEDPVSVARLSGGYLIARQDDGGNLVARFIGDDSATSEGRPMNSGFAVSPGGGVGAFVQPNGIVVAVEGDDSTIHEVAELAGSSFEVVAVEGETCAQGADCTIYVESNDDDPKVWAVTQSSGSQVTDGLISLADVDGGRLAGMVSVVDTGSCSEVRAPDGSKLWGTCENRFVAFSPDGERLLATGPYGDSIGDAGLTILSAETGEVELDLSTVQDAVITQMRWEDDKHLLAVVFEKGRWAVLRLDLDGNREYAVPPVQGSDDLSSPYILPAD